ncbi:MULTISPECIES: cell division protein ZapB [Salinicola]|jgi:cell division protein ZapB|uniref:cell division protein ZapB n=1 Tax=Salinicola TaxID=404432 RepID=UPI000B405835|nr:cell division protein ZapB [Salinicola salarius]
MNGEIFAKLEQKIQDAVDSIEMLKMENEELKAENARFQQEREEWEQRLGGLLDKLQPLDSAGASDSANQNG